MLAAIERPSSRETLLDIDTVSQIYPTRDGGFVKAVDGVSCTIGAGEFIAVLGPSGCGKSTLLSMVAGLLRPTSGSIRYKGTELSGPRPDFGIVFQDAVLFPWRDVRANVELPAEIAGMPQAERSERASALLEMVGLAGFEGKLPSELSGGMQQRVAIARSLMLNPSLILMDEPFGALDALTRERMNLELQRIWQASRKTVMLITHSISEAIFLADRVVVMSARPGRVIRELEVPIPRPRSNDSIISHPAYPALAKEIRGLLNAQGDE